MHFDESMESISDSDLEEWRVTKVADFTLCAQRASGKPDAMVVQEEEKCKDHLLSQARSDLAKRKIN